jgi:hypothetical protein
MSSLFNQASLVVEPAVYENGKVYATKPFDGTGDLTFTRASNATRVASNGLIEKVRTNLALYSEQFDNAAYSKYSATITANTTETTDPLGGNAADIFVSANATAGCGMETNIPYTSGGEYTVSIYAKYKNTAFVQLLAPSFVTTEYVNFNLQTGVIAGGSYVRTPTITSVGNGWYRCSFTFVSNYTGTTAINVISLVDSASATRGQAFTGDGVKAVYIFGAQAETGVMTDYIATTTAAVSVGPVSGLPRLDYLNSTCPRLLLEPQRTNAYAYSEQFDNAAWNKQSVTVSANAGTSPDGYTNADKVIPSTSNAFQALYYGTTSATSFTYGVFAKAAGYNYIVLLDQFSSVFTNVVFNLSAGTCSAGGKIEDYGNGWYRCSVSATNAGAATSIPTYAVSSDGTNVAFAGNGTSGVLLWGAQFESGVSYASSYIPTLGTSVTRVADAASKTGVSSLIGQQEGVVFLDFVYNGSAVQAGNLFNTNTNTSSSLFIVRTATGIVDAGLFASGSTAAKINLGSIPIGVRVKLAYAYKSGSSALYINGLQIGTSASTYTLPSAMTEINLNDDTIYFANQQSVSFNQTLLFKTRLTNAQCQELTSL